MPLKAQNNYTFYKTGGRGIARLDLHSIVNFRQIDKNVPKKSVNILSDRV